MSDGRAALLASIAETLVDYREGELPAMTPDHVDLWVQQFDAEVQVPLLLELDHVLESTYFSRAKVAAFLTGLLRNPKLAGAEPKTFWASVNFLDIQADGESQRVLLDLFDECLAEEFGLGRAECGSDHGPFVYLDDVLFSGGRVGHDLSAWLKEAAPPEATVHVIVIGTHAFGEWKSKKRLEQVAADAGKKIKFEIWRAVCFENRLKYKDESEVLWPTALSDDPLVREYAEAEEKFPFEPRKAAGKLSHPIFSSEDGRQLLERELLRAGVRIRGMAKNPSPAMRPLGFSPFGLGFGSMIVTFRNCPNNCPLALWWGDHDAAPGSALAWHPLVARKTYAEGVNLDDFPF